MTLTLTSLHLKNFGPFYGEQSIELACPPGSPVVLIHGENTLGKTQLFSALRWCLYGTFHHQQEMAAVVTSLRARANRIALREGDGELEVQARFTADGDEYTLTRRCTQTGSQLMLSADLRVGHSTIPAADIDAEIGRLLHPQISEFFLFDAELLGRFYDRLNSDRERAFIRESIETVLGIPALQLAARDLGDLGREVAARQGRMAKNRDEAERLNLTLRDCADRRTSLEEDRRQLGETVRTAAERRGQLREQMSSVQGLEADAREQEILEARLADAERDLVSLRSDLKGLLSRGWLAAAAGPVRRLLASVQEQNTRAKEEAGRIEDARLRVRALEDQVHGGTCPACGQSLPPADEDTHRRLHEAQTVLAGLLEGSGGGEIDLERERRLSALLDGTSASAYKATYDRLSATEMLQYDLKRNLANIADRLKGHRAADIRALGHELARTEQAIASAESSLRSIDEKLTEVGREEERAMRRLTKLPGAEPEVAIEAAFFAYARSVLDETIDRYRERVRTDVERSANEMFLRLIRDPEGYGGLRISPDYHVEVLDQRKTARETSEGGKQLLALSLIAALKQAAVRGGPVVLDSPLGRLDLEHRANVLQTWIPALGNQAVLLVQSGELTTDEAHRILGARIGREYVIVRPTNDPEYAVVERAR